MATNYELAIQTLAQADHVSDHPGAQGSYRSDALARAVLAVADELSGLTGEVEALRRVVTTLRQTLKSA